MNMPNGPSGNPYGGGGQSPDMGDRQLGAVDLETTTPILRSAETQRLNRKALLFLAGIMALLLSMTVWMVRSATSGKDQVSRPREETVVIPALPQTPRQAPALPAELPPAEPIALVAEQPLPPLPPSYGQGQPAAPAFPSAPRIPSLVERRTMDGSAAAAANTG